jgi:predicted TPR repeat methyltransferase
MSSNRKSKGRKSGSAVKRKKAPPPDTGQSVTLEQAIQLAVQMHRGGIRTQSVEALREARVLYERILESAPDHPDALHFFGILLHQTGETKRGVESIQRAIAVRPDYADAWSNLGNLFKESGQLIEAEETYRKAIELQPRHADAYCNLGSTLSALGKVEEAVEPYQEALAIVPDHVSAHHNLANALHKLGRREEAIGHYRAAIALDPRHPDARKLLGQALYYDGKVKEAIEVLESWAKLEPDNPEARHMLAACSGKNVPSRAADGYVTKAFDALADSFDEHLRELQYRAPEFVQAALETQITEADGSLTVLDAGCGTGLCAGFLQPYAKQLIGVDLSEGMLTHARKLAVYDELLQEELTAYLQRNMDAFDVVVSADTLCYFGDLRAVVGAASGAMRAGGTLVFTVEKTASAEAGFVLHPHGRYSHSSEYVGRVLQDAGFEVVSVEDVDLRMERNEPVKGLVAVGRKSAS